MKFRETGLAGKGFYVTGLPWSACYLLDGKRPVLFESGYTCSGRLYEKDIKQILKERTPEILFLTHVHYDHCGATGHLKKVFPALRVAGSERAAHIIRRPNARKLMAELSSEAFSFVSKYFDLDRSELLGAPFEPFDIELVLNDGDVVDLAGTSVQVIATPGHTRDLLSYYVPDRKILICTEAAGNQDRMGRVTVTPLADYNSYVSSVQKLASLPVEILCTGHDIVWVGSDEVQGFFARAIAAVKGLGEKVGRLLQEENGSVEQVVARIKAEEYDTNTDIRQPEKAYLINLRAKVEAIAKRLQPEGSST